MHGRNVEIIEMYLNPSLAEFRYWTPSPRLLCDPDTKPQFAPKSAERHPPINITSPSRYPIPLSCHKLRIPSHPSDSELGQLHLRR